MSFQAGAGDAGKELWIGFINSDDTGGGYSGAGGNRLGIDNVRLTVTPEPASMALLGLGLATLARRRRR